MLGIDNLLSAQVVTADGHRKRRRTSRSLWGLRGGEATLRCRLAGVSPASTHDRVIWDAALSGKLNRVTPFERLHGYYPDELTILSGFIQMPEGATVLSYRSTVESAAGEQAIAPLRTFGTVLVDQVQSMTYREFIHQWNAPKGRHYYAKTQSIKGFQPEIIDTLIEQGLPFSSPFRSSRCITFMEPRAARRKLLLHCGRII